MRKGKMNFTKNVFITAAAFFLMVLLIPAYSLALPMSSSDLWDVSNGVVVDQHSGTITHSDIRDMFGGNFSGIEGGNTLFRDYVSEGTLHYVQWHTPADITLRSFNLVAANEGMHRRAFSKFELFWSETGALGSWTSIFSMDFPIPGGDLVNIGGTMMEAGYGGGDNYPASHTLELEGDLSSPVTAQYFRAEFIQSSTVSNAAGPRIRELDGYDTYINAPAVPVPAAVWLLGTGMLGLFGLRRRMKN